MDDNTLQAIVFVSIIVCSTSYALYSMYILSKT